jgi:hypothetical protein
MDNHPQDIKTKRVKKRDGRCFELALREIMYNEEFSAWKLVHGVTCPPHDLSHAWLESDAEAWDPNRNEFFTKQAYHELIKPKCFVAYSMEEACREVVKNGHSGPWDDEIYAKGKALHPKHKCRSPRR